MGNITSNFRDFFQRFTGVNITSVNGMIRNCTSTPIYVLYKLGVYHEGQWVYSPVFNLTTGPVPPDSNAEYNAVKLSNVNLYVIFYLSDKPGFVASDTNYTVGLNTFRAGSTTNFYIQQCPDVTGVRSLTVTY